MENESTHAPREMGPARLVRGAGLAFLLSLGVLACGQERRQEKDSATPSTLIPEDAEETSTRPHNQLWGRAVKASLEAPAPASAIEAEPVAKVANGSRRVPNVVLIVIDTLRVDFTSLVRDEHDATPFLAELAKKAVVYENAYATASWTLPSMASLMTGLHPTQHGMRAAMMSRFGVAAQPVLPEAAYTLAEQMRDAGYTAFGVCTNQHLAPKYGMAQGFTRFAGTGFAKLPYPEFAFDAMEPEIRAAARYFLWMHYFDPHTPYGTRRPWFDSWNDSGFGGYDQLALDVVSRYYRTQQSLPQGSALPLSAIDPLYSLAYAMVRGATLPGRYFPGYAPAHGAPSAGSYEAKVLRFMRAAYASEIRATDESIRKIYGQLDVGQADLVIVTADHGEELMEHGVFGHRFIGTMSQELLHVPLLIKYPGNRGAGTVVEEPVSLVDIMPTVRGVLGEKPLDGLPGVDLSARLGTRTPATPRPVFSELEERGNDMVAVVEAPWKLVMNERSGIARLYDLLKDPGEDVDLAAARPEIVERLEKRLAAWKAIDVPRWREMQAAPLSEEEQRQLTALGYLN